MRRAFLFVLLATLFFSSMEIALKSMAGAFSTIQVNFTRFLLGGVALLPIALWDLKRRHLSLDVPDLARMAWIGFCGTVVSMAFYQLAVESAPANVVAVLFCCNTVFVLVFAHFILKTPIHRMQIGSVIFACLGITSIVNPFEVTLSPTGLIFAVAAPIVFAVYSVVATPVCRRYSGIIVTCISFLFGSLEMLLLIAIASLEPFASFLTSHGLGLFSHVDLFAGYDSWTVWPMLYVSIGVSGCGFACYFMAAELASPLMASLAFFFKPVLAPILCLIILKEPLGLNMLAGIALILTGSALSIIDQMRSTTKAARFTVAAGAVRKLDEQRKAG